MNVVTIDTNKSPTGDDAGTEVPVTIHLKDALERLHTSIWFIYIYGVD